MHIKTDESSVRNLFDETGLKGATKCAHPKGWIRHCSLAWDKIEENRPERNRPTRCSGSMIHSLCRLKERKRR